MTVKQTTTPSRKTIFPSSIAATKDLPDGAIGLPEIVFEDLVTDEDIKKALEVHGQRVKDEEV
jgi:hypothetical protein